MDSGECRLIRVRREVHHCIDAITVRSITVLVLLSAALPRARRKRGFLVEITCHVMCCCLLPPGDPQHSDGERYKLVYNNKPTNIAKLLPPPPPTAPPHTHTHTHTAQSLCSTYTLKRTLTTTASVPTLPNPPPYCGSRK